MTATVMASRFCGVSEALREGRAMLLRAGIESATLDAEILLCHALGVGREALYTAGEVDVRSRRKYRRLLRERAAFKPVAYITGSKEFWSLDLLVTPDVLVPRPETERLVEVCLEFANGRDSTARVHILELGTGSGAVAIALAKEMPAAKIMATDLSPAALTAARRNAERHSVAHQIDFTCGDLFGPLKRRGFDFVVANPPYVRSGELEMLAPEIRDWEPRAALDGGADGLRCYRLIADAAAGYLAPGGSVMLEIGADMGSEVARLFAATRRYTRETIYQDAAGRDRVFCARLGA